jgi:SAM-dependent methyltransferase
MRENGTVDRSLSIDPIWEQKYSQGYATRYPWDFVVTFLFTHRPSALDVESTAVLEVGCGTGGNLWCAAREGFKVAGIDASPSAVAYGVNRFSEEGLDGDLRVGDFTDLPFGDRQFDLAIDRAAITCCGFEDAERAVGEVWRTLKPGGKFLFNVYSDHHSSCAEGQSGPGGVKLNISGGNLVGEGQIRFYSKGDLERIFAVGWALVSVDHMELSQRLQASYLQHAEWRVVAQKKA